MKQAMTRFAQDASGSTAIKYALIAAGIFLAIVVSVGQVGSSVNALFVAVANAF